MVAGITRHGTASCSLRVVEPGGCWPIPAGTRSADLTVATVDDEAVEEDGHVVATLATGRGYTVGDAARATVTVADDDDENPAILPKRAIAREGDGGVVESPASCRASVSRSWLPGTSRCCRELSGQSRRSTTRTVGA